MTDGEYIDQFNAEYWRTLERGGVKALSRLQRDALCIISFQGEINNGGMHQYLLNSSGDLAQETPEVFDRIRAEVVANLLRRANAFFGQSGPSTDREARMKALLALTEKEQQQIHDLTDEFYAAEDHGLSLADLFDSYVLAQRKK